MSPNTSRKSALAAVLTCLLAIPTLASPPDSPRSEVWFPNGFVSAVHQSEGIIYIGGSFDAVGPYTGFAAIADRGTGALSGIPKINPTATGSSPGVAAVISDGVGGWYAAGRFGSVGATPRTGVVHLLADGTLDATFNPGTINGRVNTLALSGSRLYMGGTFTTVNGQSRVGLAALNATTGALEGWNPGVSGPGVVRTVAVSGNTVYVGGIFDTAGGQPRNNIAAIDALTDTNNATAWDPNADFPGTVHDIELNNNIAYVAGSFATIGGQPRNRIAALDTTVNTNNATAWNPNSNNIVYTIALSQDKSIVYAGGTFSNIGGQPRDNVAALATILNSNNATSWNPDGNGTVFSLAVANDAIYVGGDFVDIGGADKTHVAALGVSSGGALPFNLVVHSRVEALAVYQGDLFVGGTFLSIGGVRRNNIAAIDAVTGAATPWNPDADLFVTAMTSLPGGPVYAGGLFTTIGGESRSRIAALDRDTGIATSWNPNAAGTVETLFPFGNTIYVGGSFATIGGASRNRIAELDTTIDTNNATAWDPGASSTVYSIVRSGNTVYCGGQFTSIGGAARNRIAALDATINTNNATAWDPNADDLVWTVCLSGNTLYAGGRFLSIGGAFRNRIAALDTTLNTNNATAWDPNADNEVNGLAIGPGSSIFASGDFESIGGQSRSGYAELDRTLNTNNATPWLPTVDATALTVSVDNDSVAFGGDGVGALLAVFGTNSTQAAPPGGSGNWDNPSTWGGEDPPVNNMITTYDAEIRGPTISVTQNIVASPVAIDGLNVADGATVNIVGNDLEIATSSGVQNNGLITIGADRSLRAMTSMTIDGTGPISMVEASSTISHDGPDAILTNGVGHTIVGRGTIDARFTNNGTVRATIPGAALIVTSTSTKINNGLFEAVNGGVLRMNSANITGTGSYRADGSVLELTPGTNGISVTGETLEARNGAEVEMNGDASLTITALVSISSAAFYNGTAGASASLSAGDIEITNEIPNTQSLLGSSDGGRMNLDNTMTVQTTRNLHLSGCNAPAFQRGCIPPVLNVTGGATLTVGDAMNLSGEVDVTVNSSVPVQVAGDFNNRLTVPTGFIWNAGTLRLTGTGPRFFELAGQNFGPRNPGGFVNNYSMGTVELAADADIEFSDTFENGGGPGCEVLYVSQLTLQADSTIRVNGCRVYFVNLTNNGGTVLITNGGALMQTTDGDMNGDTFVTPPDILPFVDVLLGMHGNFDAADLNGDGLVNGLDLILFLDVLTNP
jgi:hypothetical protein